MAADDVPSPGQAPSVHEGKSSLKENATWLIALLGSLIAAVVPVTEAVRGHYELKMKDKEFQHELALKRDELQSKVELQFLTLVTTKAMSREDRAGILDVLANYSPQTTSLQHWAQKQIEALTSGIKAIRELEEKRLALSTEKDPDRKAFLKAEIDCDELDVNLTDASSVYDKDTVLRLSKEIPQCREQLENRQTTLVVKITNLPAPATSPTAPQLKPGETLQSKITVELASRIFPQTPISNIEKNLPIVLKSLTELGLNDPEIALVALSTIATESASFTPISEAQSRFNTSPGGQPFDLYDNRKDLGNLGSPDGTRYKGRGYVLLTGRANYVRVGQALKVDLENDPDKEIDPAIAAQTLALYVKEREPALRAALRADDLALVRRLTNGGSHGLNDFANAFRIGQTLLSGKS
jgi:putative chitinase